MYRVARIGLGVVLLATACASAERTDPVPQDSVETSAVAPADEGFELATGVVVAPTASMIYLARPGGGIEALDTATGEPLWSSDEAARPLLVSAGRLLAQREAGPGLPLALFDATTGDLLRGVDAALPEGVHAAIDESLQGHFRLSAGAAGADVILQWEYLERDALGVAPPEGRPFARRELGALRLDLETGEALILGVDEAAAELHNALPAPVERLVETRQLSSPPKRVGEVLAAAQQLHEPDGERLVLRRWRADDGGALPEVTLAQGRPVAVLAAADGRHLLVVTPLEIVPERPERYRWAIHSLATGERVMARSAARSATPFCLLGGRLVYLEPPSGRRVDSRWEETPLQLRALDPESATAVWQRAVRDPAFRGPAPPRP